MEDEVHLDRVRVITHFGNGRSIERIVGLRKGFYLSSRATAYVPNDADLIPVRSISSQVLIPTVIYFYIDKPFSPKCIQLTKDRVYHRDGGKCGYCGKHLTRKEMTIDHIRPVSRGGKSDWENVVCCCQPCNVKKGNKLLSEAGMTLKISPYEPKVVV